MSAFKVVRGYFAARRPLVTMAVETKPVRLPPGMATVSQRLSALTLATFNSVASGKVYSGVPSALAETYAGAPPRELTT